MTDRVAYITVAVRDNLREDDAQPLMDAIALLKGVVGVTFKPVDMETIVARQSARNEIREGIMAVLYPER